MFKILDGGFEPVRSTKYSAYVDLFAREDITIGAGETKIVKLGVKINLEDIRKRYDGNFQGKDKRRPIFKRGQYERFLKSHYLEVALRSSLAVKGLIIANGIGIIDLDYPDEIGLIVHNPNYIKLMENKSTGDMWIKDLKQDFKISKGDKVAQCTLKEHKGYLMGYESEEERKGGFGSTGN